VIATAVSAPFCPPRPVTRCLACCEPVYAGFPLRAVPDGAMHVGCYVLAARNNTDRRRGRRERRDMSSQSSPVAPNSALAHTLPLTAQDARIGSSQRAAVTVRRHKEEARAAKLTDIRAQIADGTLVVRQMTITEHRAASRAASRSRSQHQARRKVYTPRHDQESPG